MFESIENQNIFSINPDSTKGLGLSEHLILSRSSGSTEPHLLTPEADRFLGSSTDNFILALGENDTVYGLAGEDKIGGNAGNDLLLGNQDNDILYGGKGDDTLAGGKNDDLLFGDIGQDYLLGDRGSDEIFGNQGDDIIYGGKENDTVAGGSGNDQLFGNLGNDSLFGDLGADTLTGGEGKDSFYLGIGTGGNTLEEADIIQDFILAQDQIGFVNGLSISDLDIHQGTGVYSDDTIIKNKTNDEFLAILKNINSGTFLAHNSVFDSDLAPH